MSLWHSLLALLHSLISPLFAWQYDFFGEPDDIRQKRRELLETAPHGASVLEVGAGTGSTLAAGAYEASAGRFSRLVLSEPDSSMRARLYPKLRGRASGVPAAALSVVDAALPVLPFADGAFSVVVLFFVASHLEDRPASMREIARVIEPGGKLLFMDHGIHEHRRGHGHGQGHASGTARNEGEGCSEGCGEDRQVAATGVSNPTPFWKECFRFWTQHHGQEQEHSLDRLLEEFRNESALEEVFTTKAETQHKFFKEIVFGCFARRTDAQGPFSRQEIEAT